MKLWNIFRFEFAHQARSISGWIYVAVLFFFTILMDVLTTPGDGVYANNTFHITSVVVIGGFIWLVMCATIAGEAASRDVQRRMHPLTYTTPVTKLNYLAGRFLAAFAVNSLLLFLLPLGVLLSFHLGADANALQPLRPSVYLNVYFLIALPNAFIGTALQFTFAALTRQVMTSYLASLVLAIFPQLIAGTLANLFGNWDLLKLLDPIGVAGIIGSELSTWTPTEKNTRLVTLEGMFLWNRILWLTVAVIALLVTYVRFGFTLSETKQWWNRLGWKPKLQTPSSDVTGVVRPIAVNVPAIKRSFGFTTNLFQTFRIARASFVKIAKNPAGLVLVAAIAFVSAAFGSRIMTQFGIPLLPTTQQVLEYLTAPVAQINSPWVVIPLLIMYFAGQLVWNDRDARQNDIADATPVPEWVLFTGKFLGLAFIIIAWMALLMAGGVLIQSGMSYNNFEAGLYMKVLFGLQLTDYLLFALLALVVHIIVNQKNIANLLTLLIFIFLAFPGAFKVEHTMLVFGASPDWAYSDMRGFGATIFPWLCFKLYWLAWATLLSVAARLLWARGRDENFKYRLRVARQRFTTSTVWVTVIGSCVLLMLGSFIFYNTNVVNDYKTSADINEQRAQYELFYGRYRNAAQPQLTGTKLNVEIYPDKQRVDIHGAYTLVNSHSHEIDSIHIGSLSAIEPREVKFNRTAATVLTDKKLGHYIYRLQQPLKPGDSVQFSFVVAYDQRGFRHNGIDALVVKNGTHFTNYDVLPVIGYKRNREISDAVTRKRYSLPARLTVPSLYDSEARKIPISTDRNTFEAIVGTSKNEVAVGPGVLKQRWTKGERNYFHFRTDAAIRGEYAFLSGKYSLLTDEWEGVAINIYYHPRHDLNVARILRSVKTSMAFFTKEFGKYPYGHITIVEHAGAGGGAHAEASMIDYGEQYSLMNPDDSPNGFDLPYYILAHEVAHQWFGSAQLTPANVEGAGVLIEGLAVYCGMQVLQHAYGDHHLQEYVRFLHSFYEMPRSLATNSLLQANESFLYYRKGGLAMHVVSKYIGKEKVNGALRDLLRKHHSGELPLPTTLDLYNEIKKVTPDSLDYLLRDLFETNTYWRLKTKQFAAAETAAGKWKVTLKVQAQKVVIDSTGSETEVPMNDWLEVGIFGEDSQPPLYLQMHRITSGEQTIEVIVPRKPGRGGIDPNFLTIDMRTDDNILYLDE